MHPEALTVKIGLINQCYQYIAGEGSDGGEAVNQLKQDFWKNKIRTSAAERTWSRLKAVTDQRPQGATLSPSICC